MGVEAVAIEGDEGEGEADDCAFVEGAEDFAREAAGDGEDGAAFDVAVRIAPDAMLEVDEGIELVWGGERPDLDGERFGNGLAR